MTELDRLVDIARELGLSDDALDDAVYETAQAIILGELNGTDNPGEQEEIIAGAEEAASVINNEGLEAQVAYLLENNNSDSGEKQWPNRSATSSLRC